MSPMEPGRVLNTSVLVLNRHYMAVRVVTARRAFILMFRDAAEVIDIEEGQFSNYDFDSWCELSQLRNDRKAVHDDWVRAVNFDIQGSADHPLGPLRAAADLFDASQSAQSACPRRSSMPVLRHEPAGEPAQFGPHHAA